jgi:hypothetical protein
LAPACALAARKVSQPSGKLSEEHGNVPSVRVNVLAANVRYETWISISFMVENNALLTRLVFAPKMMGAKP